jgi:hypothetical protein
MSSPAYKIYGPHFSHIPADSHAESTKDAIAVRRAKTGFFDAKRTCQVYYGVDIRASGKQQFGDESPAFDEALRIGFDDNIIFGGICTGGLQSGKIILCHLNHAQATSPVGFHILVITEIGDLNAYLLSRLQNGSAFLSFDAFSVYFQGGHIDIFSCLNIFYLTWSK